ncbi:hypothetical protein CK203_080666 [Vitis vinifera]|uniref:DUF4283 domain-containing protein n=1 Tax=Vitis vinifera TaxID=29760 RepID=A0A438F0C1_VITVI|nr:hypothetical protein CK203_080666 [Vitis vinifera]
MRGGRSWFAMEAKSFEIEVEEEGGKLRGCIWERCRGWTLDWEERGRKYGLERRLNEAGRFIFCSVCDLGLKEFNIIVPEGDSLWLEAGVSEMQRRMDQLNRCLVGWWGDSKVPDPKLDFLRRSLLEEEGGCRRISCVWRSGIRSHEVLKKIGDGCGVSIKEDEAQLGCSSLLLRRSFVDGLTEDGEEEDGCPRATYSKSPKDSFAQKEKQCWGCRLRGLWRLGRNNLTIGCDVSCSCLSDVLGSGVVAVGPLKRRGREAEVVRLFVRGMGRKKVGVAFRLRDLESAIDGDLRGNLALMSPNEVIRAAATTEVLLSEASRQDDGGGELFSLVEEGDRCTSSELEGLLQENRGLKVAGRTTV